MVTLYTLGNKTALFCYVLVHAFEKNRRRHRNVYDKICAVLGAARHHLHTYNLLPIHCWYSPYRHKELRLAVQTTHTMQRAGTMMMDLDQEPIFLGRRLLLSSNK